MYGWIWTKSTKLVSTVIFIFFFILSEIDQSIEFPQWTNTFLHLEIFDSAESSHKLPVTAQSSVTIVKPITSLDSRFVFFITMQFFRSLFFLFLLLLHRWLFYDDYEKCKYIWKSIAILGIFNINYWVLNIRD
jgi:hypothetical protein